MLCIHGKATRIKKKIKFKKKNKVARDFLPLTLNIYIIYVLIGRQKKGQKFAKCSPSNLKSSHKIVKKKKKLKKRKPAAENRK